VLSHWPVWLIGCLALIAAGSATAAVPRWRASAYTRQAAWAAARSAMESAAISRDAATTQVAEAEQLLAQAQTLAAARGGRSAANTAARYARRADELWRAVAP
jgi:Family of unknown function (DUF6403)